LPKVIVLPVLDADFEGGTIEEWHKQVGDRIEVGDVIAEISTDKALVEIEAEDAGTLGKILVEAGADEVPVKTPIALLLLDGETPDALDGYDAGAASAGPAAEEAPSTGDSDTASASQDTAATAAPEPLTDDDGRLFASPVALRIARQRGGDLSGVEGSGPGGRIVLGDVESAAARQELPLQPALAPADAVPRTERPPAGTYTEVPVDKVRRVIARRLTEAKRDIPHFT